MDRAIESWLSNSCALCVTSMAISTSLSSSLLRSPAAEVGPINMVVMPLSAAMSNNAPTALSCASDEKIINESSGFAKAFSCCVEKSKDD